MCLLAHAPAAGGAWRASGSACLQRAGVFCAWPAAGQAEQSGTAQQHQGPRGGLGYGRCHQGTEHGERQTAEGDLHVPDLHIGLQPGSRSSMVFLAGEVGRIQCRVGVADEGDIQAGAGEVGQVQPGRQGLARQRQAPAVIQPQADPGQCQRVVADVDGQGTQAGGRKDFAGVPVGQIGAHLHWRVAGQREAVVPRPPSRWLFQSTTTVSVSAMAAPSISTTWALGMVTCVVPCPCTNASPMPPLKYEPQGKCLPASAVFQLKLPDRVGLERARLVSSGRAGVVACKELVKPLGRSSYQMVMNGAVPGCVEKVKSALVALEHQAVSSKLTVGRNLALGFMVVGMEWLVVKAWACTSGRASRTVQPR